MPTKVITVQHGQLMVDVALQYYGKIEGILDIAKKNGISMTDKIFPGQQLVVEDIQNETTRYLAKYGHVVAASDPNLYQGIGYWEIGKDFKVS